MGKQGTSMGGNVERSPSRRRREERSRRRQEAGWAAKSGPVTVRRVDPATLRRD